MGSFLEFGIPQELFGQLLIGLINGAFYAILSLGLAVIFGLLNIVNFAHGAQYMMGAFCAYLLLTYCGIGYWYALLLAPIFVGAIGIVLERVLLRHLYAQDHIYGLILTFGIAVVLEALFRVRWGSSGLPYPMPTELTGARDLGFLILPNYRAWVIIASLSVCLATWLAIEKTRLGSYLRAATENAPLVSAFGINVPALITFTYGAGVGLAAFAGVLAAPIYQVNPLMGSNIIIIVFAVVVIGGMGSIMGSIITGLVLGLIEGLTKVVYPEASSTVIFVIMAIVLLVKPAGLFGSEAHLPPASPSARSVDAFGHGQLLAAGLLTISVVAPFLIYPVFLMQILCLALFACAYNLLAGFGGLISFGHAAFMGTAAYITAHCVKVLGFDPISGILAGTLVAGLLGLVFGVIAVRRQGIYFAMITLALAQMVYFLALQMPFTGGEDGLQSVPRGKLFGLIDLNNTYVMYFFVLAMFIAGFGVISRAINSPFGEVLRAVKENELRATSLGYNVGRYKLVAFVLSATISGLAGSMKTLVFQIATLSDVHWTMSGDVLLMTLLGGMGTVYGPIVGAVILISLQNYLSSFGQWLAVVQGLILVACVLAFRSGVVGELMSLYLRLSGFKRAPASASASTASTHS